MKYVLAILILLLAACSPSEIASTTSVQTPRSNAQSATIQINGLNKEISLSALPQNSDLLFSGEVGAVSSVNYDVLVADRTMISLSSNPQVTSDSNQWSLAISQDVPLNLIVDIADGRLDAQLAETQLARFDLVSSNSTINIQLPALPLQFALDTDNSTTALNIPTGAFILLERLSNHGGFMSISVGEGVNFEGNINIGAGGLTLQVPETTGVQIIVESVENSEISLPNISRIPAEASTYSTSNFGTATARIVLRARLDGAALRVVRES